MSYYHEDSSKRSSSLRSFLPGLIVLVLLATGGGLFIKSTLAANVVLGSGGSIEFGQSVSQTVACSGSRSLSVTPRSTFVNASNGTGTHNLGSITVANIPSTCSGKYFMVSVFPDFESTPNILFDSISSLPIIDVDNIFYLANESHSDNVNISSASTSCIGGTAGTCYSFTVSFSAPVLVATNAAKIVLETRASDGFECIRASGSLCNLTDGGVANPILRSVTWSSIDSSSDSTLLAATSTDAGVFLSRDSGLTWSKTSLPVTSWVGVTTSANSNNLVAASYSGYVYRSTDAGATWTRVVTMNDYFTAIGASSDGTYVSIVTNRGAVYISSNSGVSFTKISRPQFANAITISSSGQYQYITGSGNVSGDIYKSSDYGATWIDVTASGTGSNLFYKSITTSSDGSLIAAAATAGSGTATGIFMSRDFGDTWFKATVSPDPGRWQAVASSSDGTRIIAASYGRDLYLSTDSGATWQNKTPFGIGHNQNWSSVSITSDGMKFAGVVSTGSIYISNS